MTNHENSLDSNGSRKNTPSFDSSSSLVRSTRSACPCHGSMQRNGDPTCLQRARYGRLPRSSVRYGSQSRRSSTRCDTSVRQIIASWTKRSSESGRIWLSRERDSVSVKRSHDSSRETERLVSSQNLRLYRVRSSIIKAGCAPIDAESPC